MWDERRTEHHKIQTARNARRDGSRPSADRDTRRVAPAGAARHWLAQLLLRGLAPGSGQWTRRQPLTQSISHSVGPRRATRWDLRALQDVYSPSRGVSSLPARGVCAIGEVIPAAARGTMCVTAMPLSATKILKDSASRQPARTTIATSAQVQGLSGGGNRNGNNHHHHNAGEPTRPQHTSIM
ncbi:hypothetical protein ALC62_01126 [Cyphomyrmex costatus]|uniref:Uncharacterized protein n=1 Tax=Cyphomyrmex costatus TaxID=456900 RepID=A0A195D692_9HYME|nr:hypothetical protein ALC62_01126 [Cyphomyrmex costatus]